MLSADDFRSSDGDSNRLFAVSLSWAYSEPSTGFAAFSGSFDPEITQVPTGIPGFNSATGETGIAWQPLVHVGFASSGNAASEPPVAQPLHHVPALVGGTAANIPVLQLGGGAPAAMGRRCRTAPGRHPSSLKR